MNAGGINNRYLFDQGFGYSGAAGAQGGINGISPGVPGNFTEMLERAAGAAEKDAAKVTAEKPVIDKNSKLFEMCRELETFLLKNLITGMRNTVQKSGFLDTGFAGKIYEDMLYDEYAKEMAENSGFGFAEMAYTELSRMESTLNIKE